MANLAMHDLKSMAAIDANATDHFIDRMKSVQTERAIVKSNDFVKQQHHQHHQNQLSLSKLSSNQWMSSTSPDPLIKPFNCKTDSQNAGKTSELLWASTQSSPNSAQRDQMRNQFKKSTSTPSNLWENLKLSPQSALMIKNSNDSSCSSVWYTPPQIQSPATSSGHSIWDSPSSSILNNSIESFGSADCSSSLLRPQDLSPNDGWYNSAAGASKLHSVNTFNTFKADSSVWSNTSATVGGKNDSNIFTSTPYKSSLNGCSDGQRDASKKSAASTTATANSDTNPASSSCLQLFSDDFINYLNMINWIFF